MERIVGNNTEKYACNKSFSGIIYCLILVFMLCSCGPQSKESYLKRYDSFIDEVSKNYSQYTKEEWELKNKEFKQLSDEWYVKFKDEFTWKEELRLTANKVKYGYYLLLKESPIFFKKLFDNPDVNKIKSQIEFYVDNQMEKDIASLLEEAKKTGKDAEAIVTQILNDLKVTIENADK